MLASLGKVIGDIPIWEYCKNWLIKKPVRIGLLVRHMMVLFGNVNSLGQLVHLSPSL